MKTIAISLPDVEAVMLKELLVNIRSSKNFCGALKRLIESEYCKHC